jgi:hypothetical protein
MLEIYQVRRVVKLINFCDNCQKELARSPCFTQERKRMDMPAGAGNLRYSQRIQQRLLRIAFHKEGTCQEQSGAAR